ncbi:hypothetical protein B0H12DRAFT_1079989 [Mycena haematopus]|nr:hypothetical protein B0H12DRAFT_1079989 [Mycena haematopus]
MPWEAVSAALLPPWTQHLNVLKGEKEEKKTYKFAYRAAAARPTSMEPQSIDVLAAGPVGPAQGWEPPSWYGRRGRGEDAVEIVATSRLQKLPPEFNESAAYLIGSYPFRLRANSLDDQDSVSWGSVRLRICFPELRSNDIANRNLKFPVDTVHWKTPSVGDRVNTQFELFVWFCDTPNKKCPVNGGNTGTFPFCVPKVIKFVNMQRILDFLLNQLNPSKTTSSRGEGEYKVSELTLGSF